jgi:hypothetical protein
MSLTSRSDPGQRASTFFAPRAEDPKRLPYPFDPRPKLVRAMIRDKKLKRVDGDVLLDLLRFRNALRNSCWRPVGKIAEELGCSKRTVQRALRRLCEAGLIEQVELKGPDPDEHNRTGWRIVFVFLAPDGYKPGPGPDRRTPQARKRWALIDARGDDKMSSPPAPLFDPPAASPEMTILSSRGMTNLSSNYCARGSNQDRAELDGETPTSSSSLRACLVPPSADALGSDDDDVAAPREEHQAAKLVTVAELPAPALEATPVAAEPALPAPVAALAGVLAVAPGTMPEGARDDDDESSPPPEDPGAAQALAFIQRHLPAPTAALLTADAPRMSSKVDGRWDCIEAAAAMLATRREPPRSPVAWVIRTAQDFQQHGISAEAKAAKAKLDTQAQATRAAQARQEASDAQAEAQAQAPPTAEDVQKWQAWVAGRSPGLAAIGRKLLEANGLPTNPTSAETTAGRISAKTPGQPPVRDLTKFGL